MIFTRKTKFSHIMLIVTCVTIVSASALDTLIDFSGLNLLSEKREIKDRPDISRITRQGIAERSVSLPDHLQLFISDVVKYYEDNFGLRDIFVLLNSLIKVRLLKSSPCNQVVIGDLDWLYFAGDTNIDYYRNGKFFTAKEIAFWNFALDAKQKWLAKRGIHYLLVIAPNKETIYPEHVPASIRKKGNTSLQDQLLQSIPDGMKEHVLDLRGALWSGKKENQVYYRTDTHWNQEGAYLAYCEIIKKLSAKFPRMRPLERSEFTISVENQPGGDLAGMLSLSRVMTEDAPSFTSKSPYQPHQVDVGYAVNNSWRPTAFEKNDSSLPRVVFMHDSFGNQLHPFLSLHFKRSLYLLRAGLRFAMNFETEEIKKERPDVVIEEIAERRLYRFLPRIPEEILLDQSGEVSSRNGHP